MLKISLRRFVLPIALLAGATLATHVNAATEVRVRDGGGPSIAEAQAAAYNGPQARIAVSRFENKTHDAGNWWNPQIGDGMADMLTTALFNTGRFIVLERESLDDVIYEQDLGASGRIRQDTAAAIGEIEGAEILVVAAVTEFDGNSGGTRGGLGGIGGGVLGAITGGVKSAHMAIDIRLIDARTSRILAATSVEGKAKDFNVGAALGGYTGRVGLGGALETWKNTPREKALRQVIEAAVDFIASRTPAQYYRAGGQSNASTSSNTQNASSTNSSSGNSGGNQVVVIEDAAPVHKGPNAKTPVVFTLGAGTILDLGVKANGWMQVKENGQKGWLKLENTVPVE